MRCQVRLRGCDAASAAPGERHKVERHRPDLSALWNCVIREVAGDYPDVTVETVHLVRPPGAPGPALSSLDVIVGSNLFGDLLTDLAGALMGSIGIAASANIDPGLRGSPRRSQPVHGSAPDIAGQGIANPYRRAVERSP